MNDTVWRRDEIESPCRKICVIHADSGLCMGCYRSRDEIAIWSRLSPEVRRAVMATLPARAPQVTGRRSGGAAGRRRRRETDQG